MAENDEMIIATSDIAFAVKKDGSTIIGKSLSHKELISLYKALEQYARICDEKDLVVFALVEALLGMCVHGVIEERVLAMKSNKE